MPAVRMIALDMDGTLLGEGGQVSARSLQAIRAAEQAGMEVVIATGRRHSYAMKLLRGLGFREESVLVSSNGTVTRTVGARLIERTHMSRETAAWMCGHVQEFRNALVVTFDMVEADGEEARGALVVEDLEELHGSIAKWIVANERYIAQVRPIERALDGGEPIQMMLCGTVERMRRAEARLVEDARVLGVGEAMRKGVGDRAAPDRVSGARPVNPGHPAGGLQQGRRAAAAGGATGGGGGGDDGDRG